MFCEYTSRITHEFTIRTHSIICLTDYLPVSLCPCFCKDAVIASTARTAVGKFSGPMSALSGPQVGAIAIREAVARVPGTAGRTLLICTTAAFDVTTGVHTVDWNKTPLFKAVEGCVGLVLLGNVADIIRQWVAAGTPYEASLVC